MNGRYPMGPLVALTLAIPLACGGIRNDGRPEPATAPAGPPPNAPRPAAAPAQPGPPAHGGGHASAFSGSSPGPAPSPAQPGPLGTVYTTDPSALASILAAAAAARPASLGPPAAAAEPAELGVRAGAAKYAMGMTAEGPVAKAMLAEGGHAEFQTTLEPGKCYAIVAFGDGMTDLELNLLAPPLYNLLAGQDGMTGPTAVLGAAPKPLCPVVPIAIPYKIDLHAKKGGGAVAAQVFVKGK